MQYDLHLMQIEEEARAEGEKIGIAKGEKIGIAKGEKIGIAKALLETAKNMILGNVPFDKIAEFTKLPIEEIKSLSAQMTTSMA